MGLNYNKVNFGGHLGKNPSGNIVMEQNTSRNGKFSVTGDI